MKEGTDMFAEGFGHRFQRVEDTNRYAPQDTFSRLKNEKAGAQLSDSQRVNNTEHKQPPPRSSNPLADDGKVDIREHFEKMMSAGARKPEAQKNQSEIVNDHIQNKHNGSHADCPMCECEACKNRRYVDQSADSAVSFQQPTRMRPEEAAHRVKAHEMEHVRREQQKAAGDSSMRIVSQDVRIKTSVCPECGKNYVSGGVTTTRTRYSDPDYIAMFKVGAENMFKPGSIWNESA